VTVHVSWEVDERWLDDEAIVRATEAALRHGGEPEREISVALVSDEVLAGLHEEFLGDPSPTDVMSFPLGDGPGPWGEVVASVDCAVRVARERGLTPARELTLYVVHGTLHLCGFDDVDEGDRRAMRAAEATVLASLGFSPE
jgi:probable rRNA maturation factor